MGVWSNLIDDYGYENLLFYGTFLVTTVAYWSVSLLYLSLDVYGWAPQLTKYKVQPGSNTGIEKHKLRRLISLVAFNWFVLNPLFNWVMFYAFVWRGSKDIRIVLELPIFLVVEECGFYYSHLMLHSKLLYKRLHKIHHEWTAPVALAALYAHPLEHVLSNLLPIALGPLLMGSHLLTAWTWYVLALVGTANAHSGYHLPLLPSPEFHDFHHLKFNQCYGVIGLLDYLHGTDTQFRRSKQFSRNVLLLSLTPLTQTFPDEKEN